MMVDIGEGRNEDPPVAVDDLVAGIDVCTRRDHVADFAGLNDDVHGRPQPACIENRGVAPHEISDLRQRRSSDGRRLPNRDPAGALQTAAAGRQRPQPPVRWRPLACR